MKARIALAVLATAVIALGLAVTQGPAAAHKVVPTKFGAKLTKDIQPSNSGQPHRCKESTGHKGNCTRILMEAYGRPDGGERAPRDGTLKHIRLIAGAKGSGIIEIARVRPASIKNNTGRAKIVVKGPTIRYKGQSDPDADTYIVETFPVHLTVKKGDYLAWQSISTSTERCDSGGAKQLLYQPTLTKADGYKQAPYHDGCFLLLEGVY